MLKNALYLDDNYRRDCEEKINYTISNPDNVCIINPNVNISETDDAKTNFTKEIKTNTFKKINN